MTEEYLCKFPTIFQDALKDKKMEKCFLKDTYKKFEEIEVYRAIHGEDKVRDDDFYCDLLECQSYNRTLRQPCSIEHYAISVNEDIEQLKLSVKFPNHRRPLLGIAKGTMRYGCGPADFKGKKTHHNWYLYEDEIIHMKEKFEMIEGEKDEKRVMGNNERFG